MATAEWDAVRRRLERELGSLAPHEFLVLGEPPVDPGPPRGLLRRRTAPPATRFVQVRRGDDELHAECVGATSFGGDWDVDEATHQRLRQLGWHAPGDDDPAGVQPAYPVYWRHAARSAAAEVAAACVDALALLGTDAASLTWRRDA